jgi:hypothetical protein
MDEIVKEDGGTKQPAAKICPLLRQVCLRDRCMFWSKDWHEERSRYTIDCAINLIACGVNDESLFRQKAKKSLEF